MLRWKTPIDACGHGIHNGSVHSARENHLEGMKCVLKSFLAEYCSTK
jgi:hypothetical protein